MRRRRWTSHWCMRADTANQARSQEQPPFRDQAHFSEFFLSVQSLVKQNNLRQQSRRRLSDCWQMVCKPGSVGLLAQSGRSFLFEHGRPCSLAAYPRCLDRGGRLSPHIWPCSSRGLPCRSRYHERGGLLLHRFTLAVPKDGGLFSVALSVTGDSRHLCPGVTWQPVHWSPDFPRISIIAILSAIVRPFASSKYNRNDDDRGSEGLLVRKA